MPPDWDGTKWVAPHFDGGRWVDANGFPIGLDAGPADRGFTAWSYDPLLAASSGAPPNNAAFGQRLKHRGGLVTNVCFVGQSPQVGGVAGQNFVGIYAPPSGARLAQSNDLTAFLSGVAAGMVACPLSAPVSLASGFYDVVVLFNMSAGLNPGLVRTSTSSGQSSAGSGGFRSFNCGAALTSLPATLGAKTERAIVEWLALN